MLDHPLRARVPLKPMAWRSVGSFAAGIPDSGLDLAPRAGTIMKCVNRHDLAVRPNDGPRIANVLATAVAAEDERGSPCFALVGAEPGLDGKWLAAVAVGQAQAAVRQAHQARRVSLASVRGGRREIRP